MIDPRAIKANLKYPEPIVLSIDFDGVIHDYKKPLKDKRMGAPIQDAEHFVKHLYDRGFVIKVYTVKATTESGKRAVEDWLKYYVIPFHEVTAIKPNAALYIDDKALHFTDWMQAYEDIGKRLEVDLDD